LIPESGRLDAPAPVQLAFAVHRSDAGPDPSDVPEAPALKLRGYFALAFICIALLLCDPVQRLVVAPWVRLAPSRRIAVLGRWQHFLAHLVLGSVGRIGGAGIPELPRIPASQGVLVLMNHQSVLDIPLVVASLEPGYPRIVTRKRYLRWIPLISHMVRLYEYPVVNPTANAGETRRMLGGLTEVARASDVPLVLFPEGTRTKDGEIGPFMTTGLRLILRQRPWTVYVVVADGFWERAKLKHFLGGMSAIRGRITVSGPIVWDDPRGDSTAFVEHVRGVMTARLEELRSGAPA
jgi:1-acyl-sn-glycerol-3-phosphate acyltransferase